MKHRGAGEQRRQISLNSEELLFKHLREWENSQGLVGFASYNLSRSLQKYLGPLQDLESKLKTRPQVILVEADPIKFITYFFAAIISGVNLFICDPHWQAQEWEQVFDLVKPDLVWGDLGDGEKGRKGEREKGRKGDGEKFIIGIPTGGSSGKIRFAVHTLSSLTASVLGFAEYFAIPKINSCCTLPLYHVSGLMQLWRCFITQGQLAIFPYKSLKQGNVPDIIPGNFFLSLVPTQLKFLLETNPDWLAKFSAVLLGGAPAWRSLLAKARDQQIKLCPTYGMTETASGVVYLSWQDFLNQNNSSGRVLPHAKVEIIDHQGRPLNPGQIGTIKIQSDSLYGGYYPDFNFTEFLITDDLGYFDEQDFLYIVGRESQKIITGGKNVFPAEVETAILATRLVKDVCVIGLSNDKWGQVVTAVFVPGENFDLNILKEKMRSQLSKYKHPKNWLEVESLGRSDRGKINYVKITQLAQKKIKTL
ncbi:MAG: 2-succinylbenzoate--CoA ligase [Cyanobacteria bacterium P01_F01_bin.143]